MHIKQKFGLAILLLVVWSSTSGMICGRVTDVPVLVKEELVFNFNPASALAKAGIQNVNGRVPASINRTVDVSFTESFDIRNRKEIKEYGGKLKTVYINIIQISVEKGKNTLNIDLPGMDLAMSSLNAADFSQGKIGSFPKIQAGASEIQSPIQWTTDGYGKAVELLKGFSFDMLALSQIQVRGGMSYPLGEVEVRVKLEITFVFNPIS